MYKSFIKKFDNKSDKLDKVFEVLFPRKCPVCDDIVVPKGDRICPECIKKIHFVKEPACRKCGKEIYDEAVEYCRDCSTKAHDYDWGFSLMNYDDMGRKIISDFKYHNRRDNADFLAEEIINRCQLQFKLMEGDVLVPVPLHFWKKRVRGFNQSEVLAKKLGELTGIPVGKDMLIRVKNTKPQKSLEHNQRTRNLRNAFKIKRIAKGLKRVILVDDIYTTGSTIDACARVLKSAGIEKVFFISACIGRNN